MPRTSIVIENDQGDSIMFSNRMISSQETTYAEVIIECNYDEPKEGYKPPDPGYAVYSLTKPEVEAIYAWCIATLSEEPSAENWRPQPKKE